jgi:hypothetical protein
VIFTYSNQFTVLPNVSTSQMNLYKAFLDGQHPDFKIERNFWHWTWHLRNWKTAAYGDIGPYSAPCPFLYHPKCKSLKWIVRVLETRPKVALSVFLWTTFRTILEKKKSVLSFPRWAKLYFSNCWQRPTDLFVGRQSFNIRLSERAKKQSDGSTGRNLMEGN